MGGFGAKNANGYRLQIDASYGNFKSGQERKISSGVYDQGRRYVYGKTHTAQLLSATAGVMREVVSPRSGRAMGVSVGGFAGLNLALLRPYYLEIYYATGPNGQPTRTVEAFDPEKHFYDTNIIGRGTPTNASGNRTSQVGFAAGVNTLLDFTRSSYGFSAIDLRIRADMFTKPVPLMMSGNTNTFVSASMGFIFGTKW